MLTSFSILFARYKGNLRTVVQGAACLEKLGEGDRLLISEGCTHHRQCGDIGTDKLPKMIKKFTGFDLEFDTSSGGDFPDDLKQYALVLHCGGCMLNEREMNYRLDFAGRRGVPITNYGIGPGNRVAAQVRVRTEYSEYGRHPSLSYSGGWRAGSSGFSRNRQSFMESVFMGKEKIFRLRRLHGAARKISFSLKLIIF